MNTNAQHPAQRSTWLDEVERFAVRTDDAPLALAALRVRQTAESVSCFACLLHELSRAANECALVLAEHAGRAATSQRDRGAESAALLARGWQFLVIESEVRS